jgi:hypothetical protein
VSLPSIVTKIVESAKNQKGLTIGEAQILVAEVLEKEAKKLREFASETDTKTRHFHYSIEDIIYQIRAVQRRIST